MNTFAARSLRSVYGTLVTMFHTVQWSSEHSMSTPTLKAIQIWAHLIGVPLDLRYNKGLSLVAGLVGEPKETDDFTKKSGEPNSFSCKGGSRSYQAVAFGS